MVFWKCGKEYRVWRARKELKLDVLEDQIDGDGERVDALWDALNEEGTTRMAGLNDNAARLKGLEKRIETLETKEPLETKNIRDLQRDVRTLVSEMTERQKRMITYTGKTATDVLDLQTAAGVLSKKVEFLDNATSSVTESLQNQINSADKEIAELMEKVVAYYGLAQGEREILRQRISVLENKNGMREVEYDAIDKRLGKIELPEADVTLLNDHRRLVESADEIIGLKDRVFTVEEILTTMRDQEPPNHAWTTEAVDALKSRCADLERKKRDHEKQIVRLMENVKESNVDISNLRKLSRTTEVRLGPLATPFQEDRSDGRNQPK